MALLDKGMKRRDFLKASAAAAAATAAAGLAGCAPSTATDMAETGGSANATTHQVASDAAIIEGRGEWMPIHCHQNCNQMCLNMGYVVDGVVVRQKTDDSHADSFDCPQQRGCLRGRSLRQQVYNADRIKYPMKRKSWQPGGGEAAHGELRGKDEWERISWDEALTYVTDELKRVYAQYGQDAVICNGWRWAPGSAMFPVIGGAVYNTECESFGCWAFQTEALGMYSHGDHPDLMMAPDKYDLPNADTIVLYGCNPAWSQHSSMYWLKNAQKAGVNFVFVGPDYNATAAAMDARWIRVRPGTDTAFLLAVAYEMVRLDEERGDIIDWDFVNERTVGFTPETMPADATTDENFRDYLLGAYDNTPKTPEWATEICGTVRCFNDFGSMLRIAQPMQGYMPGVVGIPHGVHSVFDESDPENIIDRGGSEQMLSDGLQSNYFPQVDGYNSLLIEIEKYDGEPLVEDFERGPFLAAGIDAEGTAAYVVPGADNGQEA